MKRQLDHWRSEFGDQHTNRNVVDRRRRRPALLQQHPEWIETNRFVGQKEAH
jgi:hypothetical protein